MKKALAILMVLAAITGVVFADVADVAVSGNATLSWGVDLNDAQPNGFNNEAEWTVTIPLLASKTFTTKSEGDAYAEISIVDAVYVIEGDHDGDTAFTAGDKEIDSVEAKLVFGNISVSVYDAPSFKVNNAELWEPIKADDYYGDSPKEGTDLTFEPGFDGFGTKISYKAEKFEVGVKLGSEMTWEREAVDASSSNAITIASADDADLTLAEAQAAGWLDLDGSALGAVLVEGAAYLKTTTVAAVPAARKSQYAFGVDASVTPSDMVTASATFNYATWAATTAEDDDGAAVDGFYSAGVNVVVKPVTDLEVKFALDVGNDYMADLDGPVGTDAEEQIVAYDAIFSAKYKFIEAGMYYASIGTPVASTWYSMNKDYEPIADIAAYLKVTDGDFVPELNAWATVIATNLLTSADAIQDMYDAAMGGYDDPTAPLAIGVGADYTVKMNDVNYVKPYGELYAQNMSEHTAKGSEWVTAQTVGVEYGLFTNTTVTAEYAVGATQDDLAHALIATPAKSDMGVFTLACKVTY